MYKQRVNTYKLLPSLSSVSLPHLQKWMHLAQLLIVFWFTNYLTLPPTPSTTPLPCDVAENFCTNFLPNVTDSLSNVFVVYLL